MNKNLYYNWIKSKITNKNIVINSWHIFKIRLFFFLRSLQPVTTDTILIRYAY